MTDKAGMTITVEKGHECVVVRFGSKAMRTFDVATWNAIDAAARLALGECK